MRLASGWWSLLGDATASMKFGHPVPQITANTQRTSLSKPQLKHQPMHQLLVHQLMQFNQIFLQVHKRSGQVSASHLGFVSTRAMVTTMAPRSSAQTDAHQRASARNLLWHMDPGALGLMRLASGWWSLLGDATASMKFGHPVPQITANTQRTSLSEPQLKHQPMHQLLVHQPTP